MNNKNIIQPSFGKFGKRLWKLICISATLLTTLWQLCFSYYPIPNLKFRLNSNMNFNYISYFNCRFPIPIFAIPNAIYRSFRQLHKVQSYETQKRFKRCCIQFMLAQIRHDIFIKAVSIMYYVGFCWILRLNRQKQTWPYIINVFYIFMHGLIFTKDYKMK